MGFDPSILDPEFIYVRRYRRGQTTLERIDRDHFIHLRLKGYTAEQIVRGDLDRPKEQAC